MTLGFFSPLPPARTGVADYSAGLIEHLKPHVTIRLNQPGDLNLYNIGNNQLHASIYRQALVTPGIVILHDAVLQHFMLGFLGQREYIDEFIYNYGDWARDIALKLWRERTRSSIDPVYFQYAMLKRLAERSLSILVHNPAAASIVRAHHPGADVIEIPHLLLSQGQPHLADSERFRQTLGPGLKLGIFGHLRESKRVLSVLRVFARNPQAKLVLAGEMASSDLRRACRSYLEMPNVHRIGYMNATDYWTKVHAVDACLNLRYPAAGETSGISIGMMGAGRPVIMTDSVENSGFPAGTCLRLSCGITEEAELEALINAAATHMSSLGEIGRAGQAYAQSVHAGTKVATDLVSILAVH